MTLSDRIRANSEAAPWVIEEVVKMEAEIKKLREALRKAKPVYATRKNTSSVRNEFEVGGYVKHYELPPHVVHAALDQTTIKQPSSNGEVK
jgi:hypothetical protein